MIIMTIKRTIALFGAAAASTALVACTNPSQGDGAVTEEISFTRAEFFNSVEELRQASDLIVVGEVSTQTQRVDAIDGLPQTISALEVKQTLDGEAASEIEIVQYGTPALIESEDALANGNTYLLFLTSADDDEYFITGVDAGIYVVDPELAGPVPGTSFLRSDPASGDDLPSTITVGGSADTWEA